MFLILGRTLSITKGMLKVMCASRIVENPALKWKNLNKSIREIPVTISAFIMGILVIAVRVDLNFELRPTMAIQATVPIMVEKMVARMAMEAQMAQLREGGCSRAGDRVLMSVVRFIPTSVGKAGR